MDDLLRPLFVNVCVLVALAFVGSLSIAHAGSGQRPVVVLGRCAYAALCGAILTAFPAVLAPGVTGDTRAVPPMVVALAYGPVWGALAALPVAAVRLSFGDPGAWGGAVSTLLAAVLAGLLGPRTQAFERPPREFAWLPLMIFALTGLSPLFSPGGFEIVKHAYGPLLVARVVGLLLVVAVLRSRVTLVRSLRRLEGLAHADPLTGLANRRQFDLDLACARDDDHLLVLDLDYFKAVNDTLGHAVGDEVLGLVASALERAVRPVDGVYRLGGEEFAVLLRGCPIDEVVPITERLQADVRGVTARRLGRPITFSGGLIGFRGAPEGTAFEAADRLLYEAKTAGRDRILVR